MIKTAPITRRQTIFLRSLLKNAPDSSTWPSPTILRRWLRRPAFLRALNSLRLTLNYTSDLLLAYAATYAALALQPSATPDHSTIENQKSKIDLLKLSHLRQRFPAAIPAPTPRSPLDPTEQAVHERFMQMLMTVHPDVNAREALEFLQSRANAPDSPPPSRDAILQELDRLQHAPQP
ncbi:MAG: hypothetical protein NTU53_04080 [Planctomycetota bacterium]|nr:hypothetical protein [Planctomycetota bacterium]